MDIHGLQKMTLLDFPGKVACTVFLAGCDLSCPFCHNSELINRNTAQPVMDSQELISFLSKRRGLLDGVAITGGEPLLSPGLEDLIRSIRDLGYPVKLDTNGNHPEKLKKLIKAELLDYVAMDIKNSPDRYANTCGLKEMPLEKINKSISVLLEGRVPYEFRTTVVRQLHDRESFEKIGPWLSGAAAYYLQPFTDRDTVLYSGFSAPDEDELLLYADIMRPWVKKVSMRGQ